MFVTLSLKFRPLGFIMPRALMKIRPAALVLAFAFLVSLPARGTRIRRLSLVELRDRAPEVLVVVAIDSSTRVGAARMVWTDYRTRVEEVLRGPRGAGGLLTLSFAGGRAGDRDVAIEGVPVLETGARYLIFLDDTPSVPMPVIGWTQGLFRVAESDKLVSLAGPQLRIDAQGFLGRSSTQTTHSKVDGRLRNPTVLNAGGSVAIQSPPPTAHETSSFLRDATLSDLRLFVRGAIAERPEPSR